MIIGFHAIITVTYSNYLVSTTTGQAMVRWTHLRLRFGYAPEENNGASELNRNMPEKEASLYVLMAIAFISCCQLAIALISRCQSHRQQSTLVNLEKINQVEPQKKVLHSEEGYRSQDIQMAVPGMCLAAGSSSTFTLAYSVQVHKMAKPESWAPLLRCPHEDSCGIPTCFNHHHQWRTSGPLCTLMVV